MARINVEDCFWREIGSVVKVLQDEDKAIGQALRLWKLAQERSKQGRIISQEDWQINEFSDALIPVFARKVDGGFEVVGATKHFGWLRNKQQKGSEAGKKSGAARSKKNKNLAEGKRRSPKVNAKVEPSFSPSFSSSPSRSGSHSDSLEETNTVAHPAVAEAPPPNIVAYYCDAWRFRYKAEKSPTISPKGAGQLHRLVKDFGFAKAQQLVRAYLSMPDKFFVLKRHEIGLIANNLAAISHYMDSGRMVTHAEVKHLDTQVTNQNTMDAIERGDI